MKRLISGLSSSRECARQGFGVALTEVLRTFSHLRTDEVLDLIESKTEVVSSMRGDEERERRFGRLFGYMAVLRAERLRDAAARGSRLCCARKCPGCFPTWSALARGQREEEQEGCAESR